jgi:hypothetical protein
MACETFISYKPQKATRTVIDQANEIIDEYLDQGLKLTLRQLFYQFVARALIENTFQNYKRLGSIVTTARDGGLIDWDAMEDRVREVHTHSAWVDPVHMIRNAAAWYAEDLWRGQIWRPEVWIEKAALLGVVEGVCDEFRVPYFATIGNSSQTILYDAGKRFAGYLDQGLNPIVFHLADHDPNGIDMTRDVRERLALYAGNDVEVRRIALTLPQVREYAPPPNFAKESDSRYAGYVAQFGTTDCWELDALSPTVIADLIRTEVEALIDDENWQTDRASEDRNRSLLERAAADWTKVENLLREGGDDA